MASKPSYEEGHQIDEPVGTVHPPASASLSPRSSASATTVGSSSPRLAPPATTPHRFGDPAPGSIIAFGAGRDRGSAIPSPLRCPSHAVAHAHRRTTLRPSSRALSLPTSCRRSTRPHRPTLPAAPPGAGSSGRTRA
jgi:hypothetical protein